jgi:hypothetical protein
MKPKSKRLIYFFDLMNVNYHKNMEAEQDGHISGIIICFVSTTFLRAGRVNRGAIADKRTKP